MKTAGFLKISGDHSASNVVDYNLQPHKLNGVWRNQLDNPVTPTDLVSFHGNSNLLGLDIQHKGTLLAHQMVYGMQVAHSSSPNLKQHKNWTQARTFIQSFQFSPNRRLRPQEVHQMGNEFYRGVKRYLYQQYGYQLDNCLVSTHIDRGQVENLRLKRVHGHRIHFGRLPKNVIRYPHLHNHIVVPSYNLSGEPIYPYLRKRNIYYMQSLNNQIVDDHKLNDYYFNQLYQSVHPSTVIIGKKQKDYDIRARLKNVPNIHTSNLQTATELFRQANDYAWMKDKPLHNNTLTIPNFIRARRDRNGYLVQHFDYQTKRVHDQQTKKPQTKFKTDQFTQAHQHQEWLNIVNMRLLRWHDRKEMRAERILGRFDFRGVLNKPISYRAYKSTLYMSVDACVRTAQRRTKISIATIYKVVHKHEIANKKQVNHGKIKVMSFYGEQIMGAMHSAEPSMLKGNRTANVICFYSNQCYKAQKLQHRKPKQVHKVHHVQSTVKSNQRNTHSFEQLRARERARVRKLRKQHQKYGQSQIGPER